jgi:uncharacterized membrane protein SirB2
MLDDWRNDLHYDNDNKTVSRFGTRCCACLPSLSDTLLMHGGAVVVVVAHALLTTACICYYPGAASTVLHKKSTMFCLRMRSAIGAGLR